MPKFEHITLIIESLPGARAQVQVNIPTPMPGMRLETPAHALAIDALGWLGKQPAVAGFVYGGQPHMPPQCLHQIAEPATQEPFMWAIQGPDGSAYMDEGCVSTHRPDVQREVDSLNTGLDADDEPYRVVPVRLGVASFEQTMSNWAHEDAQDAARWREAIKKIGAENQPGAARYVIRDLEAPVNVMRGSVAEHFTKSIDDVLAAHTNQEQAA